MAYITSFYCANTNSFLEFLYNHFNPFAFVQPIQHLLLEVLPSPANHSRTFPNGSLHRESNPFLAPAESEIPSGQLYHSKPPGVTVEHRFCGFRSQHLVFFFHTGRQVHSDKQGYTSLVQSRFPAIVS